MLKTIPADVQLRILLKITKQLMKNSKNTEIFRLTEILKERKKDLTKEPKEDNPGKEEIKIMLIENEKEKLKEETKKVEAEKIKVKQEEENILKLKEKALKQLNDETQKLKKELKQEIKIKSKLKPSQKKPINLDEIPLPRPRFRKIHDKENIPLPPRINKIESIERTIDPGMRRRTLRIPQTKLPERLKYLKPTLTPHEIDLEKLNILINDKNVSSIESKGPESKIMVTGKMGKMPTGIMLNEQEIRNVVNKFSNRTKIPINSGIFKVAFGKLILTATLNKGEEPRFLIEKIVNSFAPTAPSPVPTNIKQSDITKTQ